MQAIPGIPGKTADRFGDHQIYFSRLTSCDHIAKACPFSRTSTGNPLIGKDSGKLVFLFFINIIRVICDLIGKRAQLLFLFGRHPAIGCHSALGTAGRFSVSIRLAWRNNRKFLFHL